MIARPTVLGKETFFSLHLNESREGFCRRGRGRSFHVDGPKTEKAREPAVGSLMRGIWRLRASALMLHRQRHQHQLCRQQDEHKGTLSHFYLQLFTQLHLFKILFKHKVAFVMSVTYSRYPPPLLSPSSGSS